MKPLVVAAASVGLALLTFFQFPGHTWLQQDTQIYAAILEHERDPAVLRNDVLVRESHVAYTLYDEAALAAVRVTGLGFCEVLEAGQIATRALGIWGLYLCALALLGCEWNAWMVAAIVALGATVAGPAVLTFEYEPTPRAFAVPLIFCALGLAASGRYRASGIAAACAILFQAPTALPFCAVFVGLAVWRRRAAGLLPMAAALALLLVVARWQTGGQGLALFRRLTPFEEQVQHLRASYNWISLWPRGLVVYWLILFALVLVGQAVVFRRLPFPNDARAFLVALAAWGVITMPLSWLLLDRGGWALLSQGQPMRALLWIALAVQLLAAVVGVRAAAEGRIIAALACFALAYWLPLEGTHLWRGVLTALGLAVLSVVALKLSERRGRIWAPAAALAAFFIVPAVGGVVNYPRLHTPELRQLADWARATTPRDAVFAFPDAGHALDPGIFRAEALRAVYVDWKGGGQVNFFPDFATEWWFRWQQIMQRPPNLATSGALGIRYVVLPAGHRLPQKAAFENATYLVYATGP